jgi:Ca2+-binding RTX toxin-like protein
VNRLTGGARDDTYFVNTGDVLSEGAGGGTDSVFTDSNSFTLAGNVENLTFTGVGTFGGTGNGSNNVIIGGTGDDTLNGAGGADRLIGGAGNDIMTGGAGDDWLVFAPSLGNDIVNGFDGNPVGGQDLLDISAFGVTGGSFDARVAIADVGADTLITIDGDPGQTIRLVGIGNATTVTQTDFLL